MCNQQLWTVACFVHTGKAMLDASPVRLQPNACVQLRSRHAECRHCEKICPTGALGICDGRMDVGDGCIGCGRCVAACPTGALEARGFPSRLSIDPDARTPLKVDCERAPAAGADLRVPCLGGLSVSRLLALRLAAEQREIRLLDHGWCAACPASPNAKEHPAAKSLARAVARLRDAGLAEPLMPKLQAAPALYAVAMRAQPRPSRRRFLNPFDASKPPAGARFTPAPAPDRVLTLEILTRLSTQYGGTVSEKLYHRVQVDARCQGHGVCAAGCPTGALRLEHEEGNGASLTHSSQLCIACGHCERVCPDQALRLDRGAGYAPRRPVACFEVRECTACGFQFRGPQGDTRFLCQTCEKSSALARAAFHQFCKQGPAAALEP